MDNSHVLLLPGSSSRFSASLSSLSMANPQARFYGQSIANEKGHALSEIQLFSETKVISDSGTSCSSGNHEMKQEKKGVNNKGIRKHRYAFQTRSQIDILDDGYRWRKYGQKIVKNSRFPRSYYKCTHKGCNVKKQVQRNSKDEGIVVTTYEGMHTHPIGKFTDSFEQILLQTLGTS